VNYKYRHFSINTVVTHPSIFPFCNFFLQTGIQIKSINYILNAEFIHYNVYVLKIHECAIKVVKTQFPRQDIIQLHVSYRLFCQSGLLLLKNVMLYNKITSVLILIF